MTELVLVLVGVVLGAISTYLVTRRLALENQARFGDRDMDRALFVELLENLTLAKNDPPQPIVRSAWDDARRAPLPPKERDVVIAAYVAGSVLNRAILGSVSGAESRGDKEVAQRAAEASTAFSAAVTALDQTLGFSKEFPSS
jgi:hypothetical protein